MHSAFRLILGIAIGLTFFAVNQAATACGETTSQVDVQSTMTGAGNGDAQPLQTSSSESPQISSIVTSVISSDDLSTDTDWLLIDTRELDIARSDPIEGALWLDIGRLSSEPLLGVNRPILLLGRNSQSRRLIQACIRQSERGALNVHVLAGGTSTWKKHEQEQEPGAPTSMFSPEFLTTKIFSNLRKAGSPLLFDSNLPPGSSEPATGKHLLESWISQENIRTAEYRLVEALITPPIVVVADETRAIQIEGQANQLGIYPVFVLQKDLSRIEAELHTASQHAAVSSQPFPTLCGRS
jgi:rhodanese-related sulfurtransferase